MVAVVADALLTELLAELTEVEDGPEAQPVTRATRTNPNNNQGNCGDRNDLFPLIDSFMNGNSGNFYSSLLANIMTLVS